MLHWNCAANGIKTRMGVIGFNKLSDDHFQNGWHWLNETEGFFFGDCSRGEGGSQNVHLSQRENRAAEKCIYIWRDIWRMNHFQVWEHLRPWARGAERCRRFLPLPQLFPIWKHFTVQTWMWESDDLRESKWQSDSIELERRRQGKMRNGGREARRQKVELCYVARGLEVVQLSS